MACDGAMKSNRAEQGVYYIFFGTALTLLHTLLLYVQVSRYPIRTSQHQPAEMNAVNENHRIVGDVVQEERHDDGPPPGLLIAS